MKTPRKHKLLTRAILLLTQAIAEEGCNDASLSLAIVTLKKTQAKWHSQYRIRMDEITTNPAAWPIID